ncbi:hypothetical protein [Sporosarcina sp. D27]|nr:hypothetical protein [Sporosarcina sp. D27]
MVGQITETSDGARRFNICFTLFIPPKGRIGNIIDDIGNMALEISIME